MGATHGTERCRELFSLLSEYLDGELDDTICSEIDSHLDDCPPCITFLESLKRTVRILQRFPSRAMPDDVKKVILEAAARARRDRSG